MKKTLALLFPLALVPLLAASQPAEARRLFWWEAINPDTPYQDATAGPSGLDPYDMEQERFNQRQYEMYRNEMNRRYGNQEFMVPDSAPYAPRQTYAPRQGYALPQPPEPPYAAPLELQPKPTLKPRKIVKAKPAAPKMPLATASTTPAPQASNPQASNPQASSPTAVKPVGRAVAAVAKKPASPVSCDKGASIVSSFGFDNVKTKSCDAGTLAYNAERSGTAFQIDVNPKTGELIAVKKL